MANQSSTNDVNSETRDSFESKTDGFVLTKRHKEFLIKCIEIDGIRPFGINKHLDIELIRQQMNKTFKLDLTTKCLWDFVDSKWNIAEQDASEVIKISNEQQNFHLSEEYDTLTNELSERIKKNLLKEGLNGGCYKTLNAPIEKGSKSSSKGSSLKESNNLPLDDPPIKIIKISKAEFDKDTSSRKLLNKFGDKEFVGGLSNKNELLPEHRFIEIKNDDKDKQISDSNGQKLKIQKVSESSFHKPSISRSFKIGGGFSDCSSISVISGIQHGKPLFRTVSPEIQSNN